jgi:hypothetical protein
MQSRGWIVAAAMLVVSGCATQTEWDRGCDGNARWSYGSESAATWLRETRTAPIDRLMQLARLEPGETRMNLCWYTDTGSSYGILRVRRADRRADVEALYQDDGDGWRLVSVSSRGWPPDPND